MRNKRNPRPNLTRARRVDRMEAEALTMEDLRVDWPFVVVWIEDGKFEELGCADMGVAEREAYEVLERNERAVNWLMVVNVADQRAHRWCLAGVDGDAYR